MFLPHHVFSIVEAAERKYNALLLAARANELPNGWAFVTFEDSHRVYSNGIGMAVAARISSTYLSIISFVQSLSSRNQMPVESLSKDWDVLSAGTVHLYLTFDEKEVARVEFPGQNWDSYGTQPTCVADVALPMKWRGPISYADKFSLIFRADKPGKKVSMQSASGTRVDKIDGEVRFSLRCIEGSIILTIGDVNSVKVGIRSLCSPTAVWERGKRFEPGDTVYERRITSRTPAGPQVMCEPVRWSTLLSKILFNTPKAAENGLMNAIATCHCGVAP
ncbi:hypothetical protein AG1IA_08029 [Rhizoctonia solani AG-1 IA]|uniref:Uncharacterized protein n=1 Tax=Thanatephorus cucumeris (strain AG1-IA) TaxID=983506 RepID=L8WIA9_THACA|nr:hypothetical protein AG1IA_08029 [Rhizoctonia solani AG-1 IA]